MPPLKATPDETRDLIAFLSSASLGADLKVGTTPVGRAQADATANDFAEILKPRPGDWPTYHGRLDGNRHSALAQITTAQRAQPLAEVDSFRARLRQRDDAARPRRHHVHHRDQSGVGD